MNTCNRCGFDIADERLQQDPVICNHCGFSSEENMARLTDKMETRYMKLAIVLGVFILTGWLHLMNWDRHFFVIIPLKLNQLTGTASAHDYRQIADICSERFNHSCTTSALRGLATTDPKNADVLFELGEILRKTGDTGSALVAYQSHFDRGGHIPAAAYELGRIYDARGETDKAVSAFTKALDMKPEVIQVTVIQAYVHMLERVGRLNEAAAVIADVRMNKGVAAKYFMTSELERIQKALGKSPTRKI